MVKMDNVVRCYCGIDPVDGYDSFFAVKNGLIAPDFYCDDHPWLEESGFLGFDAYDSRPEPTDNQRLAALDQFELLWEKQE